MIKYLKQYLQDVERGAYYARTDNVGNIFDKYVILIILANILWRLPVLQVKRTICLFFDHKLIDTSSGGPESGQISGHCERCNYSYHQTLY